MMFWIKISRGRDGVEAESHLTTRPTWPRLVEPRSWRALHGGRALLGPLHGGVYSAAGTGCGSREGVPGLGTRVRVPGYLTSD